MDFDFSPGPPDDSLPPTDAFGPDLPLPEWFVASERIQREYIARPADCAVVAVTVLFVIENTKVTYCLRDNTLTAILSYADLGLFKKGKKLVKTWDRNYKENSAEDISLLQKRVSDAIKATYSRKSSGLLFFRRPNRTKSGHVVAFNYNIVSNTLDIYDKNLTDGRIIFTSIGADNQDEAISKIFIAFFALYYDGTTLLLDEIYEIVSFYRGGSKKKCRKCGLPKLCGGVAPDRKVYFELVKQSYEPSASKKVGDWELVAETPTLKFYKSGNDVVVSIRGTFDSRDTKADATIAVNSLHLSDRFKEDERFLNNFKQQNPNLKYYGVGHSLGGAILDLFLHKGLISEGQSYNPAVQPHDFGATLPNHRIFMSGDPLYTLVRLFLKQKPEVIKENSSIFRKLARLTPIGNIATAGEYLKSHGLEQFEGKGKRKLKGKGKPNKEEIIALIEESYKKLDQLTERIGHNTLLPEFSTDTMKVYLNKTRGRNSIIVVVRGTIKPWNDLSGFFTDLSSNLEIRFGKEIDEKARYVADESKLRELHGRFSPAEYDYYGLGHSLGGAIIDNFIDRGLIIEAWTFNPAIQEKHWRDRLGINHRYYIDNDPLYEFLHGKISQDPDIRPPVIVPGTAIDGSPKLSNSLKAHSIDAFKGKELAGLGKSRKSKGKSPLTLHAVIVKKPYDLQEARAIARDVMKSKKDKFMRETSTSYRFRNLPKTKFSSFVTKVLNPQVSLVFGNLKN